jgi:hypothetical protein
LPWHGFAIRKEEVIKKEGGNMKIKHDREEAILLVEPDPSAIIDHAQQVDRLILHVSPEDRPVLLEILDAS